MYMLSFICTFQFDMALPDNYCFIFNPQCGHIQHWGYCILASSSKWKTKLFHAYEKKEDSAARSSQISFGVLPL